MNKKINLTYVIIGLISIVIVVVLVFILNIDKPQNSNDDKGAAVSGLIDNKGELVGTVTAKDYYLIQDRFMDFFGFKNIDKSTKFEIEKVEPSYRDGSTYTFYVSIPSQNKKNIKVIINYAAEPTATFSIPSENFSIAYYGGQS